MKLLIFMAVFVDWIKKNAWANRILKRTRRGQTTYTCQYSILGLWFYYQDFDGYIHYPAEYTSESDAWDFMHQENISTVQFRERDKGMNWNLLATCWIGLVLFVIGFVVLL